MKKNLLLLVLMFNVITIHGQYLSNKDFLNLPLEEKVEYFFSTFKDSHTSFYISGFASNIVHRHGFAVMPFIKERLEQANYFTYTTEPKDITLTLIGHLMIYLHSFGMPYDSSGLYRSNLPVDEIQWFVNEYMRRIDEYVLAVRVIDETARRNDINIASITPMGRNKGDFYIAYLDYPYFGDKPVRHCGADLKRYFEERLGIDDLIVDSSFVE